MNQSFGQKLKGLGKPWVHASDFLCDLRLLNLSMAFVLHL